MASALLLGAGIAAFVPASGGDIVVTGQGLPAAMGEGAYAVKLIDRSRLALSASSRLEDVLRDAGIHQFRRADSRSAHPTSQGIAMRGLGGNASARALVLLDGVPIADPFGGWIDWPALDPARLGFVRVTRGGGAGPFGSGALAGTVELGSAARDQLSGFSGGIAYGSRSSVIVDAAASGDLGAGFATLSARLDKGDGFIPIIRSQRGTVDEAAGYRQWSTRARAVVRMGGDMELQASTVLFGDRRDRGTPFSRNESRGADASVRLIGRGDWAWEALGYVQSRKFSSLFAAVSADRSTVTASLDQYNTPATGLGAKVELRPPVGDSAELRLGLDHRQVVGRTKERFTFVAGEPTRLRDAGGRTVTTGAFVEASLQPMSDIVLTGGARMDRWRIENGFLRERTIATGASIRDEAASDRSQWEPTGRLGVAFSPTSAVTFRTAAYLGYRLPTLNELYRPFRAGADATAANPALRPERLKGVEAGMDFQPLANARAGATVFWNRLDNAIANVTLGAGPGLFPGVGFVAGAYRQRLNVDGIRARGLELDAGVAYGGWDLSGSYVYADSRVRASGSAAALDGLRPAQTPRHQASVTVAMRSGNIAASVTGRYVSGQSEDDLNQRALDSAVTADAAIAVSLGLGFTLEARAENLTNTRIEAAVSGSGIVERAGPRTLWLGARYTGR